MSLICLNWLDLAGYILRPSLTCLLEPQWCENAPGSDDSKLTASLTVQLQGLVFGPLMPAVHGQRMMAPPSSFRKAVALLPRLRPRRVGLRLRLLRDQQMAARQNPLRTF